jgi:hypothetical protein
MVFLGAPVKFCRAEPHERHVHHLGGALILLTKCGGMGTRGFFTSLICLIRPASSKFGLFAIKIALQLRTQSFEILC